MVSMICVVPPSVVMLAMLNFSKVLKCSIILDNCRMYLMLKCVFATYSGKAVAVIPYPVSRRFISSLGGARCLLIPYNFLNVNLILLDQ